MKDVLKYVVNVEAAVFRGGEYLLAERSPKEDHAPETLSLIGGKVEAGEAGEAGTQVLEGTVRRELREEVGVEIDAVEYVTSNAFVSDGGASVVNVVFLARYASGEPRPLEPEEVAAVHWMRPASVLDSDDVPVFTQQYVERVEETRQQLGW